MNLQQYAFWRRPFSLHSFWYRNIQLRPQVYLTWSMLLTPSFCQGTLRKKLGTKRSWAVRHGYQWTNMFLKLTEYFLERAEEFTYLNHFFFFFGWNIIQSLLLKEKKTEQDVKQRHVLLLLGCETSFYCWGPDFDVPEKAKRHFLERQDEAACAKWFRCTGAHFRFTAFCIINFKNIF